MPNFLTQLSLFPSQGSEVSPGDIPGLTYIPGYITEAEERKLIHLIDLQQWSSELIRRVQHYGYKYMYKAKDTNENFYLGPLPEWLAKLGNMLKNAQLFSQAPDQVIINEYQPGQGIASHIDHVHCFDDVITSLSLGSLCVMEFIHEEKQRKIALLIEPRSLLILSGEARYKWKHGIAPRKTDYYNGRKLSRNRRISITFRKVLQETDIRASFMQKH